MQRPTAPAVARPIQPGQQVKAADGTLYVASRHPGVVRGDLFLRRATPKVKGKAARRLEKRRRREARERSVSHSG